jgi:hypothetical protein
MGLEEDRTSQVCRVEEILDSCGQVRLRDIDEGEVRREVQIEMSGVVPSFS